MTRCLFVILFLITFWGPVQAQTIFIVRHAERTGEPDPPLNADGQRRAEALSRLLADAGVYNFYTSEAVRTHQTAEPTARHAKREIEVVQAKAIEDLVNRVRQTASVSRPTLIVGHRETVPRIVKALGGGEILPLRSDEHDRLIILTLLPGGSASVVTLRYGS